MNYLQVVQLFRRTSVNIGSAPTARGLESLLNPLVEQAQWFVALNDNRTTSAEKDQNDALMTTLPPSTLLH
jgi:hypothetical protein